MRHIPVRMTIAARACALLALVSAVPAGAATLGLPPAAVRTAQQIEVHGSYPVPTAPWTPEGLRTRPAEGQVTLEAWQVGAAATTLDLLAPLRAQIAGQGYEVLFECAGDTCGGFDFRYETVVLPEPEMHVDLADFRFLAAARPGPSDDYLTLLVSRTSNTGYIQVARVGPAAPAAPVAALSSKSPAPTSTAPGPAPGATEAPADLARALETTGRAVLDDLSFEPGSATLTRDSFASLDALAAYLLAHPDRRVALVGHTDAEGSLTANLALSRARARTVMQRLTEIHAIPPTQVEADGVGYLMPRASNLTDEGRMSNRRVEAVLTSVR